MNNKKLAAIITFCVVASTLALTMSFSKNQTVLDSEQVAKDVQMLTEDFKVVENIYEEQNDSSEEIVFENINEDSDILEIQNYTQEPIEVIQSDKITTIYLSSTEVSRGEKGVGLSLSLENNPGILGMLLSISYDESIMTLTNVDNGVAVNDVLELTHGKVLQNNCNFLWDGIDILSDDIRDGEILSLSFDISNEAPAGEYKVEINYLSENIVDNDLDVIPIQAKEGYITVKN